MTSQPDRPRTAVATVDAISRGDITCEDAMRHCLEQVERLEPNIQAFVDIDAERAIEASKVADTLPTEQRGPLHGLPVAVKAVFDVAGMHCNWGTSIHHDRVPEQDAVAVRLLRESGAVVVGTTVSTEYAIADAGPTRNPFDPSCTPGGSSSGSAAAVASGMVSVALGSQTVGSVVRPAVYCGLYGLKPTRGAIPKRGGMALSPRLDHPGLLARTPDDVKLLCNVLFERDDQDPDSMDVSPPMAEPDLDELRVLVVRDWPPGPASPASLAAVEDATEILSGSGASIEQISLPDEYGAVLDVLYTIMTHDMAQAHGGDRDSAGDRMSEHLRGLIDRGRSVTDEEYSQAALQAEQWRGELNELLKGYSVMLSTATEGAAPPRTEGTGSNRQQALWSLVGMPVMAIPTGLHGHLPIGVQIGAGAGREASILAATRAFSPRAHPIV